MHREVSRIVGKSPVKAFQASAGSGSWIVYKSFYFNLFYWIRSNTILVESNQTITWLLWIGKTMWNPSYRVDRVLLLDCGFLKLQLMNVVLWKWVANSVSYWHSSQSRLEHSCYILLFITCIVSRTAAAKLSHWMLQHFEPVSVSFKLGA